MKINFVITYHNTDRIERGKINGYGVISVASTYEEATELLLDIMNKKNEESRKLKWSLMCGGNACYRVHRGWTEWMEVRELGLIR